MEHWRECGYIDALSPAYRVIALDNRTRRSYASQNGPPGNVSVDAMVDQIPLPPLPAGREILIVVAPLQVIGPPVLDEIVAPLSYRIFDAVEARSDDSPLDPIDPLRPYRPARLDRPDSPARPDRPAILPPWRQR